MPNITISLDTVIYICTALITISGAIAAVRAPIKKVIDTMNKHDQEIQKLQKSVEENNKNQQVILTALNAILNHMIDGNGIDRLREVRDSFQGDVIKPRR